MEVRLLIWNAAWEESGKDGKAHIVYAPKKELRRICKNFGLVFQSFHLFPHYTVLKNIIDEYIYELEKRFVPDRDFKIFALRTAKSDPDSVQLLVRGEAPILMERRRTDELLAKGQKANYDTILKEIQQRDYQDTHRPIAPLKMARDSVKVDTTELDIAGVVAAIKAVVSQKIGL